MKECRYCGTNYENAIKSCPNCGGTAVVTEADRQREKEQGSIENAMYTDNSKRLRKLIFSGVGIIVAIIIVVVIAISVANSRTYTYSDPQGNHQEITKREIDTAIQLGRNYLTEGNYTFALREFRKVPSDYNDYGSVMTLISQAEEGYADGLLEKADEYLSKGDFSGAFALFESEITLFNSNVRLAAKRNEVLEKYKNDFIVRVNALLVDGKYSEAITLLDSAENLFGNDADLSAKRTEILGGQKADSLERASVFLADKMYTEALSVLETAKSILGNDSDISAKINEVNKAMILDRVNELEKANDLSEAIIYLEREIAKVPNDTDLMEKLAAMRTTYKSIVLRSAEDALRSEGYLQAIQLINTGILALRNDPDLLSAIEYYRRFEPVPLENVEVWQTLYTPGWGSLGIGPYSHSGPYIDNLNNSYNTCFVSRQGTTCWNMYRLDGEFQTFKGRFCIEKEYNSQDGPNTLRIYGDNDVLLYSISISGGDDPVDFSVDISSVNYLKIEMHISGDMSGRTYAFMANVSLHR